MYFIIRKHHLPEGVSPSRVKKKYNDEFKKTKVLISEWDMNFWIRKKHSMRSSLLIEHRFVFDMTFDQYVNTIKHDTIVQNWLARKKSKEWNICYTKTRKKTKCSICLDSSGLFVQIQPCKCLFHKECIIKSSKYSTLCPLCNKPIKEKSLSTNVKKKKTAQSGSSGNDSLL